MVKHPTKSPTSLKNLVFLSLGLLLFASAVQAQGTSGDGTTTATITQDYDTYLRFHWKGALTSHSITLKVFPATTFAASGKTVFVALYTKTAENALTTDSIKILPVTFSTGTGSVAVVQFDSLTAGTKYYYNFLFAPAATSEITAEEFTTLVGTTTNPVTGEFSFKTLGVALTSTSFTFGIGCCTQTGSTNEVFKTLAGRGLDFFVYAGDMNTEGITTNDNSAFYNAYYKTFDSRNQKDFFQSTPLVYIWDDDDFGGSSSGGSSTSKSAATTAFKNFAIYNSLKNAYPTDDSGAERPDAPVATVDTGDFESFDSTGTDGIFRSFLVGRCMFIILDLRSFKDLSSGDILGSNQAHWLENQLNYASQIAGVQQVFLVSTLPWINKNAVTDWTPYVETQKKIGGWVEEFITDKDINKKIMLIGGHVGMVGFDDGTNNAYGAFPVVQAGALDKDQSCQGGAYSHGLVKGRQQFGTISVVDNGVKVCVQVKLERNGESLIQYDTCNPTAYEGNPQTCSTGILDQITDLVTGGSWTLFIIAIVVVVLIVLVILWKAYQSWKKSREAEEEDREEDKYLEMTESTKKKNKRENELL